MYKKVKPFFMIVETPLHAGSGTDLGTIDMPIQRERHTEFPKIESSGLKGCIRQAFEEKSKIIDGNNKADAQAIALAFGPENGDEHAGALGFTDARLLMFPVKSMKGVFSWITCPKVLERFNKDLKLSGINGIPDMPKANTSPQGCQLFIRDKIVLEEYTFTITKDGNNQGTCTKFAAWLSTNAIPSGTEYNYWREKIKNDIVILSDDDFRDFVNLSTEVITRIKVDNKTGTVERGALFTEEYLPSESILYSLALTTPIFKENGQKGVFTKTDNKKEEELMMEYFTNGMPGIIQIGGNATIGKGLVRVKVWGKNDK